MVVPVLAASLVFPDFQFCWKHEWRPDGAPKKKKKVFPSQKNGLCSRSSRWARIFRLLYNSLRVFSTHCFLCKLWLGVWERLWFDQFNGPCGTMTEIKIQQDGTSKDGTEQCREGFGFGGNCCKNWTDCGWKSSLGFWPVESVLLAVLCVASTLY